MPPPEEAIFCSKAKSQSMDNWTKAPPTLHKEILWAKMEKFTGKVPLKLVRKSRETAMRRGIRLA
jgi:hypothetical protein